MCMSDCISTSVSINVCRTLLLDLFLQKLLIVVSSNDPGLFVDAGLNVFATGTMLCPLAVQKIGTGTEPSGCGAVKCHSVQARSTKFKVDHPESFRLWSDVHKRPIGRNEVVASWDIFTSMTDRVMGSEAGVGHLSRSSWTLYIELFPKFVRTPR